MFIRRHTITVEIEQTTLHIEHVGGVAPMPAAEVVDAPSPSEQPAATHFGALPTQLSTGAEQAPHRSLPASTGEVVEEQVALPDTPTRDTNR